MNQEPKSIDVWIDECPANQAVMRELVRQRVKLTNLLRKADVLLFGSEEQYSTRIEHLHLLPRQSIVVLTEEDEGRAHNQETAVCFMHLDNFLRWYHETASPEQEEAPARSWWSLFSRIFSRKRAA